MQADGFLAIQGQFDRPPRDPGQQRGLRLDRHVLLAAEGAAVGHQLDEDLVLVDAQEARHLAAVVEDALALGVEMEPAIVSRGHHGALRLQVEMLDPLCPPGAADDVCALGQRRLRVATPDDGLRQHIVVHRVDSWCAVGHCRFGV